MHSYIAVIILDSFFINTASAYIEVEDGGGGEPQSDRLQWNSAFFKVKCPTKRPHCIQTVTKHM